MKEPAEPRRRIRLKRWHWIAFVLLLPFVAGIVAVKIRRHGLEKEIARELAAIRARGEPVTLEELDAWYPKVPDAENGALAVMNALKVMRESSEKILMDSNIPDPVSDAFASLKKSPVPVRELDRIRNLLSANQPGLEMLHSASTNRAFLYPVSFTSVQTHLGPLRRGILLLSVEAGLRVVEGDTSAAADSWTAASKLADSLTMEPLLVSWFSRSASSAILHLRIAEYLRRDGWSHQALSKLEAVVSEDTAAVGLGRVLRGELASGLKYFEPRLTWTAYRRVLNPMAGPIPPWWEPDEIAERARFYTYRAVANDAADQLHLVRSMTSFCAALDALPHLRMAAMSNAVWQAGTAPGTDRYLFSQVYLSPFANLIERDLRMLAAKRTLRTAIALERFRLDSGGGLPDSLDELVPKYLAAVPSDPFTGRPLRYIRHHRGYVVYSVGENLTDEQGAAKSDIPFTVEK